MKNIVKNTIWLMIISQLLFYPMQTMAEMRAVDSDSYTPESYNATPVNDDEIGDADDITDDPLEPSNNYDTIDESVIEGEDAPDDYVGDNVLSNASQIPNSDSPSAILANVKNRKIILNFSDESKLKQMQVAASLVPNLETDLQTLAELSGKNLDDLKKMQQKDPQGFKKLLESQSSKVKNNGYIKQQLLGNPSKLAEFLGIAEGEAIDRLASEKSQIEKQIDDGLTHTVDSRVLKMLTYLITPKDQGGAGHYRIKVESIMKGYNTVGKQAEKEDLAIKEKQEQNSTKGNKTIEDVKSNKTEINPLFDPSDKTAVAILKDASAIVDVVNAAGETTATALIGNSKETSNTISAHFSGQAVDISEIDDIKCTLIEKKRIGSDKKTPMGPQPIKLGWQTQEGYNADKSGIDSSYNQMFLSATRDAMQNVFAAFGVDISNMNQSQVNSFSDMSSTLAASLFSQSLDIPASAGWTGNLSDTLLKVGGSILANKLGLPEEPFYDSKIQSSEALAEAIGRTYLEKKLNLPYGSLVGDTPTDILANAGLARIASELNLPARTLSLDVLNGDDLYQKIGSRIVEDTFGLAESSTYKKATINDMVTATGKSSADAFFKNPINVDKKLGLASGTTKKLKDGSVTLSDYTKQITSAKLAKTVFQYPNYEGPSSIIANGKSYVSWRDEMMNLPNGTLDSLFSTNTSKEDLISKLKAAGSNSISKVVETSDKGISRFASWLENPNDDYSVTFTDEKGQQRSGCLPLTSYATLLNISSGDIYAIFGQNGASKGVLKRLGKKMIDIALLRDSKSAKINDQSQKVAPEFKAPVQSESYYKEKAKKAAEQADLLDKTKISLEPMLSSSNYPGKEKLIATLNDQITALKDSKKDGDSWSILKYGSEASNKFNLLSGETTNLAEWIKKESKGSKLEHANNMLVYNAEIAGKYAYEIKSGSEQKNFRYEDTALNEINPALDISTGDGNYGTSDLALFFSGRVDLKNFLKSLGSSKISSELNMPSNTLKNMADNISGEAKDGKSSSDTSLRSIGLSLLQDKQAVPASINGGAAISKQISFKGLIKIFADSLQVSEARAKSQAASALNLGGYNADSLMRGDFGEWGKARNKAEENDLENNLPKGATEKFIRGEALGGYDESILGKKNLNDLSNSLDISESSVKSYLAKKEGSQAPEYNKIYYKSYNSKSEEAAVTPYGTELIDNKSLTNGYAYYDTAGLHMFASYYQAEQYRIANPTTEITATNQIASQLFNNVKSAANAGDVNAATLANKLESAENFSNKMSEFATNKQKETVIDGETNILIENFLCDKYGLDRSLAENLFSRTKDGDISVGIDLIKMYGYSKIKSEVLPTINEFLGTNASGQRLDSNDITKILNGQGSDVLGRLGSSVLEAELGIKSGTILSIVNTKDDTIRDKRMEEAALQLIGKSLGTEGITLDGSLLKNFGDKKLSLILGIADKVFGGGSISELVRKLSPIDFAKSFKLPIGDEINSLMQDILGGLGADVKNANKNKDFYAQLEVMKTYMQNQGLDRLSNDTKQKISNLNNKLGQTANAVISNATIVNGTAAEAKAAIKEKLAADGINFGSEGLLDEMIGKFKSTLLSIDNMTGLPDGTSAALLMGDTTPEDFIVKVAGKVLRVPTAPGQTFGDVILNKLDISSESVTGGIINDLIKNILNERNPLEFDIAAIYPTLLNLFTANLDSKAGFEDGTFKTIINDPQNAPSVLIKQGIRRLDQSLISDPDSATSFKNFLSILPNSTTSNSCNTLPDNNPSTTYNCMSANSVSSAGSQSGTTPLSPYMGKIQQKDKLKQDIQRNLIQKSEVEQDIEVPDAYGRMVVKTVKVGGVEMDTGDIEGLFNGDFRPLSAIGVISNIASSIGKIDLNGRNMLAVPYIFIPKYADIFAAVYGSIKGDPNADDVLADRAGQYALSRSSFSENPLTAIGVNMVIGGNMDGTDSTALFNIGSTGHLNIEYPLPAEIIEAGLNYLMPDEPELGTPEHLGWELLRQQVGLTEADARASFRELLGKELQYKLSDCALFKNNKYLPAGFTKAMMEGNPFDKTEIMLSSLKTWFKEIANDPLQYASTFLPEEWQDVYTFMTSDGPHDLNAILDKYGPGLVTKLDSFITSHVPTVLGINLGEGVAGSLMSFVQTRDISGVVAGLRDNVSGIIKNFKTQFGSVDGVVGLIGGWADEKLGLPQGSVQAIYMAIRYGCTQQFAMMGIVVAGPLGVALTILAPIIMDYVMGKIIEFTAVVEAAIGLVPGSIMQSVMIGMQFGPMIGLAYFLYTNLFGVYKTEIVCTADGYYPSLEAKPDESKWEVGNLGTFDGMDGDARKQYYIKAAQHKAGQLVKDALNLTFAAEDPNLTPVQIMTGRDEDVYGNLEAVKRSICAKVGSKYLSGKTAICSGWGTRSGLWSNPQTTAYTHIGF